MTSPQAIQEFVIRSTEYVKNHAAEIQQLLNTQRNLESEIIQKTNSFCPLAQIQNRSIKAEDIQRALKDGYADANILKTLMCVNNSMLALPPSTNKDHGFKVREYLENLKQIGGESAEGYAML